MGKKTQQIVVWESTIVGDDNIEGFEDWMKEHGFNVKYLTEFTTLPDMVGDKPVPNTGGRNDLLFEVASDDILKFAVWRLQHDMRWWEDYLDNGEWKVVPPDVLKKYPYGWNNTPNKYIQPDTDESAVQ